MKTISKLFLMVLLGAFSVSASQAQNTPQAFSLQQAIDYALQNQQRVQIAKNDVQSANARVGEIRAVGLPQINAGAEIGNNFVLQKTLLDPSDLGGPPIVGYNLTQADIQAVNDGNTAVLKPKYFEGTLDPIVVAFARPWTGNAAISANQLLFDGSYLIGLKAASTYTQLAKKAQTQTEIEVVEAVSKAYYGVLVSTEQMALLQANLRRLDTLLYQTNQMYKNGFVEKLDVDRLQVARNNLDVERQKVERLLQLGEDLLQFQMGMPQNQPIVLTDKLAAVEVDLAKTNTQGFNYSNRIEYSLLETQRDLAMLDLKNKKAGYLPQVALNARYGYSGFSDSFSDLMSIRAGANNTTDRNWFDFGYVGLGINIPIFDGLRKHYQTQQAKLSIENAKAGLKTLEQAIDLELNQSSINLTNSMQVLESRKSNMALAEEIARVSKIKFQEGVGSNLEVITAETELREAQTNYYSALYDALISKVDLDVATGTLR